jgi:hypothetical protein
VASRVEGLIASAACIASLAASRPSTAAPPPAPPPTEAKAPALPQRVRLAVSKGADKRLAEVRLRRLLAIELGRRLEVGPEAIGPLNDDLVQVWIDVPEEKRALIHVRRMGRSLARRVLDIGGYSADTAARVVALETSEMIRVQVDAPLPDPCSGCRVKPNGDRGGKLRFAAVGSAMLRWIPKGEPYLVAGPRVESEHHLGPPALSLSQSIYGQWLISPDAPRTRWIEGGFGVDAGIGLARGAIDWRLRAGVRAGFASVSIGGERPLDTWTANAAGRIAIETSPVRGLWLGLAAEPGAILRPIDGRLRGFTLGAALTIAGEPGR